MGVYKNNLVSIEFTPAELQAIDEATRTINDILRNKVINLTPAERTQYGSIHEKNKLFVNKARDYVRKNSQFLPPFFDAAEFMRDYEAREQLGGMLLDVNPINEKLRDTKIALDFDNYQAALGVYSYVQLLASQNIPGMTSWYQEMRQFFPRTRRNNGNDNTPVDENMNAEEPTDD